MDTKLRQSAVERIATGTAPFTRGWPTGIPALTLLHRLASAPETASDALKLLHELQVHQVELDLQHDQAEQECHQLGEDLSEYTALFDHAPFAYLALEPDGRVIAANCLATDWLATDTGPGKELAGRGIEDLLATESRAAVRDMLAALRRGLGRQTCTVSPRAGGAGAHAVATSMPDGGRVLMVFLPAGTVPASAAGH